MCVSRSAVIAFVALDFADLDHLGGAIRASVSVAKRQNSNVRIIESDTVEIFYLSHIRVRWAELQSAKTDDLEILRLDHSPADRGTKRGVATASLLSLHVIRLAYPEASAAPLEFPCV